MIRRLSATSSALSGHGQRLLRRGVRETNGASAVEFSLLAPVFCLIMVGTLDFGSVLYTKFNLDGAVSAATNYTINNAASVSSTSGAALATRIAMIVSSGHESNWADATVTVNNGPVTTVSNGATSTSGTAANADLCFCPVKSGASLTWGSSKTCGSPCSGGGVAGKFVAISARRAFNPIFATYGLVTGGSVAATSILQVF